MSFGQNRPKWGGLERFGVMIGACLADTGPRHLVGIRDSHKSLQARPEAPSDSSCVICEKPRLHREAEVTSKLPREVLAS